MYIGLRDVDAAEKKILKENGIKAYSMHEVDKYGIGKVVEMALDHVNPGREKPIHLSFDVDALDPTVAPSELFSPFLIWVSHADDQVLVHLFEVDYLSVKVSTVCAFGERS